MPSQPATLDALKAAFGELPTSEFRDQTRVVVPREKLFDALKLLKEQRSFGLLVDVTCVDYLAMRDATDRFGLVYLLANPETAERITIRCMLNEPELNVPSACPLWQGANWLEREVYDMFGIIFDGHPDLRRILLPDEFAAFPLRKDYPLQGRGERHNFERLTRTEG